jgi:cytochrome c peroxidase
MKKFIIFQLLGSILFLGACQEQKQELPQPAVSLLPVLPSYFPPMPQPAHNPMTVEGITLGRMLFYDKNLSRDGSLSCASCHQQKKMFADGIALSAIGLSKRELKRNSPTLLNIAWAKDLFWDGGATNLESLSVAPLTAIDEMHKDLLVMEKELAANPVYKAQFAKAFPTLPKVNTQNVLKALAQFQRTLVSYNSKYDLYIQKKAMLTVSELEGLQLVEQKCTPCHSTTLFTDNDFHNNGLDDDTAFTTNHESITKGRGRVTFNEDDNGKYRTPSLRNVMLTAPYMHDGRFATIDEVLNHYTDNIKISSTLSPKLKQANGSKGIVLSLKEKQAIIAFLHTLTDVSVLTNPNFSQP